MLREVVCLGFHWTDPPREDGIFIEVPRTTDPLSNRWGLVSNKDYRFTPDMPESSGVWICPGCIARLHGRQEVVICQT